VVNKTVSNPVPVVRVSFPAPPTKILLALEPIRISLPALPLKVLVDPAAIPNSECSQQYRKLKVLTSEGFTMKTFQ
jgi:hypothetical protein